MKKTLLIGSALVIGFAGFSQSNAKRVVTKNNIVSPGMKSKKVTVEGPSHSNIAWKTTPPKAPTFTIATCPGSVHLTSSWNANGVGGSTSCVEQNCLAYNKDLNALVWTQRGSKDWALFLTSGGEQATIINHPAPSPHFGYATNVLDSVVIFSDASTNLVGGRFPGGSWLNPTGNTDYHKAYACGTGPYNAGSTWLGSIYVAKPLWSTSAVGHSQPTFDSLHVVSGALNPVHFMGHVGESTQEGAPNADMQMVGANTVMSTGYFVDSTLTNADATRETHGFILKGTIASPGLVNWTVDATSLNVAFYNDGLSAANSLGNHVAGAPRLAFGPDGMHGYAVYIGKLAAVSGNSSDSCMTPVLFKTTDGGTTWTHVLAGYDWTCKHPELNKNMGLVFANTRRDYWNFSNGAHGLDVTVDKNNVLHMVCTMEATYVGAKPGTTTYSLDSSSFGYNYPVDNSTYHSIIWDNMTDGTQWTTMMVDSLQSSVCNGTSTDTSSAFSAFSSTSPDFLTIGAHLTVSRSVDGSKIFYGWADTPAGITGFVDAAGNPINPNTNPDLWVKGYDVNTNMFTPTKDITSGAGNAFFPYLADISYYDSTQSAWVAPAVYAYGRSSSNKAPGFTLYDGTAAIDYFYTNCGSFTQSTFNTAATIYTQPTGTVCSTIGIEKHNNNAFASSISNYPNPFSNTTTIAVTLTENKPVSINVYNAIGTLVFSKKVDGNVGTNNVTFDGGQVSSGVYYYTVTAGNQQATKKMVIQK